MLNQEKYKVISDAIQLLQGENAPVSCLDANPHGILTGLKKMFKEFKHLPDEKKPRVMVVNLLNKSGNYGTGFHPIGLRYLMGAIHSLDPGGAYKNKSGESNLLYYNEFQLPKDKRTDENFLETTKNFHPDIVLYSVTTSQTKRVGEAIKFLKSEGVKPLNVVGGVDAIIQPDICLERTGADIAIVGEGPIPVKMLVSGWKDPNFPLSLLPGLVVAEPEGSFTHYNKPVYFENPDMYDFPSIFLTEEEKKRGWRNTVTRAFNCPYNCPFCGSKAINMETTGHMSVRMKSEKKMLAEIEFGFQNNAKFIYFADDTLFLNVEKSKSFLIKLKKLQQKYAKNGEMVPWAASSRIGEINKHPELLKYAVEAGCIEIEGGKETGSDAMIQKIKKVDSFNKDLFKLMDHFKEFPTLKLGINFITGLPGSTFIDELQTVKLAIDILNRKQPVTFHIHRFVPLPGTDYWNNPERHGLTFDKNAVMDNLSTYGVEELIRSKSLPHSQAMLIEEILNTVLRAKGAISFRSPYLTVLTSDEQHPISTFITSSESQREIEQNSIERAVEERKKYQTKLEENIEGKTIQETLIQLESRERKVASMEEISRLAYLLSQNDIALKANRDSTPEKETNKDIITYLRYLSNFF